MSKNLSQARAKWLFSYADGQLFWLNPNKPNRVKTGDRAGCISSTTGYRHLTVDCERFMEHQVVFLWHHGWIPEEVDHINGVRDDNRIENLRPATKQTNKYNAKKRRDNPSGVRNVGFDSQRKKWRVSVRANGVVRYAGRFDDLELAELVAIEARDKYHREFARHD